MIARLLCKAFAIEVEFGVGELEQDALALPGADLRAQLVERRISAPHLVIAQITNFPQACAGQHFGITLSGGPSAPFEVEETWEYFEERRPDPVLPGGRLNVLDRSVLNDEEAARTQEPLRLGRVAKPFRLCEVMNHSTLED